MKAGSVAVAFDAIAPDYDALFSDHPSGRIVRRAVWEVTDRAFARASRVLDLGCGTGVDALHLAGRGIDVVALDISGRMVDRARRAVQAAGVAGRVTVDEADVGDPATWTGAIRRAAGQGGASVPVAMFDGALADFGVLNCIGDLRPLGAALAALIPPGGRFVAVVMPPFCAWESALGLLHGDIRRATRRWRGQAGADLGTGRWPVWYRPPQEIARGLGPEWRIERVVPIGAVVPPSWAVRRGGPLDRAWLWRVWAAAEAGARRLPMANAWSDHVAVVLRRGDAGRMDGTARRRGAHCRHDGAGGATHEERVG